MKKIFLFLSIAITFASCKSGEEIKPPASEPSLSASSILNLSFGNNITDASSGQMLSTSSQGTFVADQAGNANSAYYLAGSNKLTYSLNTYSSLKVGTSGDFSISIKIKHDTTYLYNQFLALNKLKYASFFEIGDGLVLRYLCNNDARSKHIQFVVRKAGNLYWSTGYNYQNTLNFPSTAWKNNDWNTITVVYKRNPANVKLYFNGTQMIDENNTSFDNVNIDYSGANQLLSFGSGAVANQSWQGTIDNVYIVNRVLTVSEIQQIANQ